MDEDERLLSKVRELKANVALEPDGRPTTIVLCGSTRFKQQFQEAAEREIKLGKVVLTVAAFSHADGKPISHEEKQRVDGLYMYYIEMAHEVLILNVNGYMGESTSRELAYAKYLQSTIHPYKRIRYLEN